MDILQHLGSIADEGGEYREFNKRIVVTGYEVLGVRMPALRAFARQLAGCREAAAYLENGLHGKMVYEEVLLYGLTLAAASRKMSLDEVFRRFDALVPHFDSWAHTDVIISRDFKIFGKHLDEVFHHFLPLKTHPGEFRKRTFVILLMTFFMDEAHIDRTLRELTGVPQGQYYVDMAIAWTLAEGLVKHYETTLPLLEVPEGGTPVFSRFVHNKAIQKARESFRVTPEQKEYLNGLKIR